MEPGTLRLIQSSSTLFFLPREHGEAEKLLYFLPLLTGQFLNEIIAPEVLAIPREEKMGFSFNSLLRFSFTQESTQAPLLRSHAPHPHSSVHWCSNWLWFSSSFQYLTPELSPTFLSMFKGCLLYFNSFSCLPHMYLDVIDFFLQALTLRRYVNLII